MTRVSPNHPKRKEVTKRVKSSPKAMELAKELDLISLTTFKRVAAPIKGATLQKEKNAAGFGFTPKATPVDIVLPDLEMPGSSAKA